MRKDPLAQVSAEKEKISHMASQSKTKDYIFFVHF